MLYENSHKTITKSEIEITNRARVQSSKCWIFQTKQIKENVRNEHATYKTDTKQTKLYGYYKIIWLCTQHTCINSFWHWFFLLILLPWTSVYCVLLVWKYSFLSWFVVILSTFNNISISTRIKNACCEVCAHLQNFLNTYITTIYEYAFSNRISIKQ